MIDRINIPGLLFLAFLALVWQVSAVTLQSPNLPSFVAVITEIINDIQALLLQIGITLRRAGIGFLIALVTMIPLGIFLGRIKAVGAIVEPIIEFLRPLPPIAIVPIAMMILGVGDESKLVVVVFGASFPILVNTIDAVKAQDPILARVAQSLRLSNFERMVQIGLPSALPRIVAGVKLSVVISILLTVVAEIILSTDGIGAYLLNAQYSYNVAGTMAAIIMISLAGVLVNAITQLVLGYLLAWHEQRSALANT